MLGYRKKSFDEAWRLISVLRANRNALDDLKSIQILLIKEICRTEVKIKALRAKLKKDVERGSGDKAPERLAHEGRLASYRKLGYIWRCFGDAVAFLYMDRFAIKQTYYNIDNTKPKQGAGFIGDKAGLKIELLVLTTYLDEGTPALLVDLTNSIRHGDVCLMDSSDPYLIEVKSGGGNDTRASKQRRGIRLIHKFFENDEAAGLRGVASVRRIEYRTPPKFHLDVLNRCIEHAAEKGHCLCSPEPGLHYLATLSRKLDIHTLFGDLDIRRPWLFFLNEAKNQHSWSPYYPFILSIENKDRLYDFIHGDLTLTVIMDTHVLESIFRKLGFSAAFTDDEIYPIRVSLLGTEGELMVSKHIMTRIGLDFASAEWIARLSVEGFTEHLAALSEEC